MAEREKRLIVSMDLDFPQLLATRSLKWPSLILFRLETPKPEIVGDLLENILETYATDLGRGVIISVTETQIRVRNLPIIK